MFATAALFAALLGPAGHIDRPDKHVLERPPDRRVIAVRPYRAKLNRMAWCESRQRWHIATGNGYFGGLQFDAQTWHAVGGRGLPHWYSKLEQMWRAVKLIRIRGYVPWPICGSV